MEKGGIDLSRYVGEKKKGSEESEGDDDRSAVHLELLRLGYTMGIADKIAG
jgi:hypothetical protein